MTFLLFCVTWGALIGALGLLVVVVCEAVSRIRLWTNKR